MKRNLIKLIILINYMKLIKLKSWRVRLNSMKLNKKVIKVSK